MKLRADPAKCTGGERDSLAAAVAQLFPTGARHPAAGRAAYANEIMEREALRRFVQAGVESPGLTPEAEVWSQHERELGPLGVE